MCVLSIMHAIDAVKITVVSTYNNTMSCICHIISTLDYRPTLSLVRFTANFTDRLSTFTYSFQESCSLYPRCTPYFSVEHTVSPQSVVSNTSSGCSVEYTILNLMRCRNYHSTATALLGNQRGNTVVVGDTVMLSELLQLIWTNLMIEGLASITLHSHNNFKSLMELMARLSFHILCQSHLQCSL